MRTVFGCVLWLLLSVSASAGPMVHHIESTLPRGGQRGTTVEVTLQGVHLGSPREVIFFRPGITAIDFETLPPPSPQIGYPHSGRADEQIRCKFVIAPDCPLGEHPFKIRTATELTMLSTFWVTPFPIVMEAEKSQGGNDTLDKALPVRMNSTVHGQITTSRHADFDIFRVAGKKGEHLSVEVNSVWLTEKYYGDAEFDLMIRLLDSEGHELAHNDDSALHLQDPIVSVVLPKDGEYYVEIRQPIFRGGANIYYLAHIGSNRRPLAAYPAGGPAGQPLAVKLIGDPAGEYLQTIKLPEAAGNFDYYDDAPSPLPMRVSDYPNVLEVSDADVTPVSQLPAALNGIIERAGDVDTFRLLVKKGDAYRVRVFARALGTPLDPRVAIRHVDADLPEVDADDASHADRDLIGVPGGLHLKEQLDPSVVWEPKQTGDYLLTIRDMRSLGDETSVYRVEIEPVHDAVHTYLYAPIIDSAECPRLTAIAIPRGNRWTVNVSLGEAQGNRYKGELEIVARGLPPGVQMIAPRVRSGQRIVPVQFIASVDTPPQSALIELLAQPVDSSRKLESGSHQSFAFMNHSGGRAWHSLRVDRYALAITEPSPYSIELAPPRIPLSQSGELAMQVNLTRHGSFDEAVEIQFDWTPPGIQAQPTITIEKGETSAVLRLFAGPSAQPGTSKVALTASTTGGSYYLGAGRIRVSSAFVDLITAEPYVALKNKPTAVRRGETSQLVWDVEHKKPFAGEADAVLIGLPKGVTTVQPTPKLKSGDKQLVFEVAADSEALLGQYKELTCEIIVRQAGQEIRQRTGKGILRVDPALSAPTETSGR